MVVIRLLEEATMIHRLACRMVSSLPAPFGNPPSVPYTSALKKGKNYSDRYFALRAISNVFESVRNLDDKDMSA